MKTKIFSCRADFFNHIPRFIFMSGPDVPVGAEKAKVINEKKEAPNPVPKKSPQEVADTAKALGKALGDKATADLDKTASMVKDAGGPIIVEMPLALDKNYNEVTSKKTLAELAVTISLMKSTYKKGMKPGDRATSILNETTKNKDNDGNPITVPVTYVLSCEDEGGKIVYRLFKKIK